MAEAGTLFLAEAMLWLMYAVVAVALVATAVSAARHLIVCRGNGGGLNGWLTLVLTAVLLLITYLVASDQPLLVNGTVYDDGLWLKITDMVITSTTILIAVAALFVIYGVTGVNRKIRTKTKK